MRCCARRLVWSLFLLAAVFPGVPRSLPAAGGERAEVEAEDLRPGLVAHYRSLVDKEAVLDRVEAKPAFYLGDSSPHPRIPPGPFEVVWTGTLRVADKGPLTFDALVCGEVAMEVDGVAVLAGRGENERARVGPGEAPKRPRGLYRLQIRYRSLAGRPARLQIGWEGPTFTHEPLPAWHLGHQAADLPAAAAREQLAEYGRAAVVRLGCARCHAGAFPGAADPPPGPSLAEAKGRIDRAWLLDWLAGPNRMRPDARMPDLFAADRNGFVERWIIVEHLLGSAPSLPSPPLRERGIGGEGAVKTGDHRAGRTAFIAIGCAACHFLPEADRSAQPDLGRTPLAGLSERLPAEALAAFLVNPHGHYPDGRMPRLPLSADAARNIAAYLLLWSKPARSQGEAVRPPTGDEINAVARRLGVRGRDAVAAALLREKRCAECHPGLGAGTPADIPLPLGGEDRGCLSGRSVPRFALDAPTRKAIATYRAVAAKEKHPSAFAARQRQLDRLGCARCHQRDSDRPPPIEAAGITEPGWMAQPDRGALFRIDFTGKTPFEMQTIRVLPHGFRIVFTEPLSPRTAGDPASYQVEHYRYEYTGAYGSPELDRTRVAVERVAVSADGRSVELTTAPLVKDRVYLIQSAGVRSARGEGLVHPIGAYTLNEIPSGKP